MPVFMKRKKSSFLKRIFLFTIKLLGSLLLLILLIMITATQVIRYASHGHLYELDDDIPHNRVGLVLGTAPYLRRDMPNPYFQHRMQSAARLFHEGKVDYLLVSGDNRTRWYNEPEQMRRHLVGLGVPNDKIYLDYAGLRTLDSVVRCREIFGQDQFTVISQKFHNERAIFIAQRKGIQAIGYNAPNVSRSQNVRTQVREWFARVKVFYDLLTRKQPRHLGETIIIGEKNL
jgi:SanA protein